MLKRAFALGAIIVLAVLFALLYSARTGSNTFILEQEPASGSEPAATAPALTESQIETDLAQPSAPTAARVASTVRLADGDSFDIVWADTGEFDEVRLYGINAPEANACFGQAARDVLLELVSDQELIVESIERDEFGRVLANVWVGDVFLNAKLVELGAALPLSDGGTYAGLITASKDVAQQSELGLWSPDTCGAQTGAEVLIVWIEADAPGRDDENQNGEWIEIVNDAVTAADLSGWGIRDESTRHRFSFPDGFTLGAGDAVRVFSGCGDDTNKELYWCDEDPVWNNGGDTGFLVDPDGRFADTFSYTG